MSRQEVEKVLQRIYPEVSAGGFSRCNSTHEFYSRVQALLETTKLVVDFGAGRGIGFVDAPPYLAGLRDLRGSGRRVVGVDIDEVVLENPSIDEAHVVCPGEPLPFADASVDLMVFPSHVYNNFSYTYNSEPAYFGASERMWRSVNLLHRFLPERFAGVWLVFLQKLN